MSDLDDLEGIADLFKREVSLHPRNRKDRANALSSIERAHGRRAKLKAAIRSNATKHRKIPITLAPIKGESA